MSNFYSYIVLLLGRRISFVTARTSHLEVRLSRFHCKAKVKSPSGTMGRGSSVSLSLPIVPRALSFYLFAKLSAGGR